MVRSATLRATIERTITMCRGPIQGYLTDEKPPPQQDFHRALGRVLLQGPRGAQFLLSEAPLYHVSIWDTDY